MRISDDEQEDWTAPGVFRVAPGIYRIPMPLPDESRLRAVNVYAIEHESAIALIDSGWAMQGARDHLSAALSALGAGLGDVRQFLVTHQHRDHYTLAVELRREFRTPISVGDGERDGLLLAMKPGRRHLGAQADGLRQHGASALADAVLTIGAQHADDARVWELPDDWLRPPQKLDLGGRCLRVVATPGHTRGHVTFVDEDEQLLFAGDHVLPHITPSIGFEPVTLARPLRAYLDSLRLVRDLPDARLLPAHGPVLPRAHPRIDELLAHHYRRLDAAAALLQRGPQTAYEVAEGLRWTRRERRLDELDVFNQMLAVLETAAHLDVLVDAGRAVIQATQPCIRYAAGSAENGR
jgi:glyoxylase-like metal-dependent hydrolase (beta-lactamase superfamily II)